MTGLGTPVANRLVPDLVAYQGPGTSYAGPTVGPLQDATLSDPGPAGGGEMDVFSVFDALTVAGRAVGAPTTGGTDRRGVGLESPTYVSATTNKAATREMNEVPALVPAAAAPASTTVAAGIMPLADAMAAHDAALTGWSWPSPGFGVAEAGDGAGAGHRHDRTRHRRPDRPGLRPGANVGTPGDFGRLGAGGSRGAAVSPGR